ncbi:hypothetical protein MYVA_3721 [Mycolicibacterium vaccae 95051]|nr:hypothetical protein MYVA_3721 [Mycolicibacterium vaccae 95051]
MMADHADRRIQVWAFSEAPGGARLCDGQLSKILPVFDKGSVQLVQATHSQRHIRRPGRCVKTAPCSRDRPRGVPDGAVRRKAQNLTGRGVDGRQ